MKKKIILGFMLSAAFGFFVFGGDVSAMVVQATETATFIPPSPSPTALNVDCPIGTPAGWGTYTPSPLWLIECEHCSSISTSTVTASLVPTWNGTGTPPTASPTMTVTPTVTATPVNTGLKVYQNGICYDYPYANTEYVWSVEGFYARNSTCTSNASSYKWLDADFFIAVDTGGYDRSGTISYTIEEYPGTDIAFYSIPYSQGKYSHAEYSYSLNAMTSDGWSGRWIKVHMGISGLGSNDTTTKHISYIVSLAPIELATPTPAPTATPFFDTGYCSSVTPVLDDFGFDLFMADGEPNCDMGWDEFTVGETTVSAVQICLQPVQVGVIRLFGTDYEVGIYFLAVAAAFFWRYMRTV